LKDVRDGSIVKECMKNHAEEFTGGKEEQYRGRFITYISSCGCFLMDKRIADMEEVYNG
jgi:hypothetical protein